MVSALQLAALGAQAAPRGPHEPSEVQPTRLGPQPPIKPGAAAAAGGVATVAGATSTASGSGGGGAIAPSIGRMGIS